MKYLFILFTFLLNTSLFCQDLYHKLDSTTRAQINLLSSKNKKKFDTILLHRSKKSLETRIDTTQYDYLFIEESFCYYDSSIKIIEIYFTKDDSIPRNILVNNKKQDLREFNYRFKTLFNSYSTNKAIQETEYSKTQVRYLGCVVFKDNKKKIHKSKKK